jgi:hypothetical protein
LVARQVGGNDQFVELNGNNPGAIRQTVTVGVGGLYNFSFYYGGYAATESGGNPASDYELRARARIVDSSNNVVHSAVVSWSIAAGGFNGSWINTPYTAQFVLNAGTTYYVEFETLHFGGVDSNGNYYSRLLRSAHRQRQSLAGARACVDGRVGRGSDRAAGSAPSPRTRIVAQRNHPSFSPSPVAREGGCL